MIRYALLPVILLLTACATPEPVTIVETVPVQLEIAQPPMPRPVNLIDIDFDVVTTENLDTFIEEQKKVQGNDNPVFFALSVKDYESLSLNLAELRRYIEQQRSIIVYYQNATVN